MGPIGCPKTSVRNYHFTLGNDPEERRLYPLCHNVSLQYAGVVEVWNQVYFLFQLHDSTPTSLQKVNKGHLLVSQLLLATLCGHALFINSRQTVNCWRWNHLPCQALCYCDAQMTTPAIAEQPVKTQFNCTQILCLGPPNAEVPSDDIVSSWVMILPSTPDGSYKNFGGKPCCIFSTETIRISEELVPYYQIARCHKVMRPQYAPSLHS